MNTKLKLLSMLVVASISMSAHASFQRDASHDDQSMKQAENVLTSGDKNVVASDSNGLKEFQVHAASMPAVSLDSNDLVLGYNADYRNQHMFDKVDSLKFGDLSKPATLSQAKQYAEAATILGYKKARFYTDQAMLMGTANVISYIDKQDYNTKQEIQNQYQSKFDRINKSVSNAVSQASSASNNLSTLQMNYDNDMSQLKSDLNSAKSDVDYASTKARKNGNNLIYLDNRVSDLEKKLKNGSGSAGGSAVSETVINSKISAATDTAKSYADQQDAKTLDTAKKYTDTKSSQTLSAANAHADQEATKAVNTAKQYTDNVSKTTLETAKSFTTQETANAISQSQKYTDTKVKGIVFAGNKAAYSYADNGDAQTLASANAYTDKQVSFLNKKMDALENKVDVNNDHAMAGIAGAIAVASIPTYLDTSHNSYSIAFGAGSYGGQQAFAGAVKLYNEDINAVVNINTMIDSQQNVGFGVGAAWKF